MYCKKCGQKLHEDDKFCPNCGTFVSDTLKQEECIEKKASFKDGIKALFSKIFLYSGRSSRSEFNFGLLFLVIVSMPIIYMIMLSNPDIFLSTEVEIEQAILGMEKILDYTSLFIGIVFSVFLSAPLYRRLTDIYMNKKISIIYTICFVLSYLFSSNIILSIFPDNILMFLDIILMLLNGFSIYILVSCMVMKKKELR